MASPTVVLDADPPGFIRTRFGNRLLRGQTLVTLDTEDSGTRLTQEFQVEGLIPRVAARIFATGSAGVG